MLGYSYANNLHFFGICDNIMTDKPPPRFVLYDIGALAQLARAPALQAGGQEFESLMLHQNIVIRTLPKLFETDLNNY